MGTVVVNPYFNDLIGSAQIVAADYTHGGNTSIAQTSLTKPIIIGETPTDGADSEGNVTAYVAATAVGTPQYHSNVAINETNISAGAETVITVTGTDAHKVFAPGDVIHAHDNAVVGTIKTVDSATQITLMEANKEALAGTDVAADRLYNISPIHLILSFER